MIKIKNVIVFKITHFVSQALEINSKIIGKNFRII